MICIFSRKLAKSNYKFMKYIICNSKSEENKFVFMGKVSDVLCHSENLGSRQEEWKMLRMQLQ